MNVNNVNTDLYPHERATMNSPRAAREQAQLALSRLPASAALFSFPVYV